MQAGCQEEGLIAFLFQALDGNICSERYSCFDCYPHVLNNLDLTGKNIFGEAVLGNSYGHHAAGNRQFFEYRNLISLSSQEIGRCQAGWT